MRVSYGTAPTAQGPLRVLTEEVQDQLHLPDPAPLYCVVGTLIANLMSGDPVWLMLIGPPSCGKTELLRGLEGLCGVVHTSTMTEAALLPASGKRGGLLREIGDQGLLVLKDFSSVISMRPEKMGEVVAALREIYDCKWDRSVGAAAGAPARTVPWRGKMGLLTACTPAIDRHHKIMAEMGERFTFYRYPATDGYEETSAALSDRDPAVRRDYLRMCFAVFNESVDEIVQCADALRMSMVERHRLISLGSLAAMCRGTVSRHKFTREVEEMAYAEVPARLTRVLGLLYRALIACQLQRRECWRTVVKIGLDSMPQTRRKAMLVLGGKSEPVPLKVLADVTGVHPQTMRRALEDLALLGVIEQSGADGKGRPTRSVFQRATAEHWVKISSIASLRGRGGQVQ